MAEVYRYVPPDPLPGLGDVRGGIRPVESRVTVVIPTLGRPILEQCLASMVGGDVWPACIIVVDQGMDDTVERLLARVEALGVTTRRIHAPPRGRAAGLNLGLRLVDTEFLAVTDDDCVVAPDWISQITRALEAHPGGIISGRVEDVGDEASIAHALSMTYEVRTRPSLIYDLMLGGNLGMHRSVLDRAGFFDEDPRVRLAEDTEYAYRALRSGVSLAYVPDVAVWHYAWRDAAQRAHQLRGYARCHGAFYGKYIRRGDLFIAARAALHLGRAARRWARSRWRGDAEMAVHGRSYALGLLPGILEGLKRGAGAGDP